MPKGWKGESARHSAARRGIKTREYTETPSPQTPEYEEYNYLRYKIKYAKSISEINELIEEVNRAREIGYITERDYNQLSSDIIEKTMEIDTR